MADTVKAVAIILLASLLFGLVLGFSKACTAELFNNNEPTIVYYTPNTQGITNG